MGPPLVTPLLSRLSRRRVVVEWRSNLSKKAGASALAQSVELVSGRHGLRSVICASKFHWRKTPSPRMIVSSRQMPNLRIERRVLRWGGTWGKDQKTRNVIFLHNIGYLRILFESAMDHCSSSSYVTKITSRLEPFHDGHPLGVLRHKRTHTELSVPWRYVWFSWWVTCSARSADSI